MTQFAFSYYSILLIWILFKYSEYIYIYRYTYIYIVSNTYILLEESLIYPSGSNRYKANQHLYFTIMEVAGTSFTPWVCGIFLLLGLSAVSDGLILHSRPNTDHIIPDPRAESKEMRWADAAYDFVKRLDCKDVFITSPKECKRLVKIPKNNMNVYVAGPTVYGRYRVNLPGESLTRSGPKDGVVVLDPYPTANFGHIVLVFFIEKNVMREVCERQGGHFAGKSYVIPCTVRFRLLLETENSC